MKNPLRCRRGFSCTAIGSAEFLNVLHQLFQRFDVVLRMHGVLEAAQLLEVGLNVLGSETFIRVEADAQRALPAHLAHPAATHFEQTAGLLAVFGAQIDHQRADQFGFELLEGTGREQAFGHAGAAGGGNGVDEDVVLAAFNGQGAGQTIEAELGHAVVGLTEVAVDAGGGGGEDDAPEVLLLHLVPRSMSDLVGPFHMNLVDQIPVGVGHLGKTLVAQDAGVVHDDIHPAEVIHGALYDLVAIHNAVRVGNGSAAGGLDFFHDLQRSLAVGTFPLGAAAEIVDHDLGTVFGEQQGMRPANAAAGAGYDNGLVFKTAVAHGSLMESWYAEISPTASRCRP